MEEQEPPRPLRQAEAADKKFGELSEEQRQAMIALFTTTAMHHAAIVQKYSFAFVNFLLILNAGALSTIIIILSGQLGPRIIAFHPYTFNLLIVSFAIGLLSSIILILNILIYSARKYHNYLLQLKRAAVEEEASPIWPGDLLLEPHISISIVAYVSGMLAFSFAVIASAIGITTLISAVEIR